MSNAFDEVMSQRTDRQLAEIIVMKKDQYQPEAYEAAKAEFLKRGLDVNSFFNNDDDLLRENHVDLKDQPLPLTKLEWYHKAGIVLLPILIGFVFIKFISFIPGMNVFKGFGFPVVILGQYLLHEEAKKRSKILAQEVKTWIVYTYFIYTGILLLAALLVFLFWQF